jgi:Flp pilus assembly protein CpaB
MSVTTPRSPQSRDRRGLLATRNGSLAVAVITAILAAAILVVFVHGYRSSVDSSNKTAPVLVSQRLIEKGSSGDVIAAQGLYQVTRVKRSELKDGAISDPSNVRGKVAARQILPGEQFTSADFTKTTDSVVEHLGRNRRAISLPMDGAHGMIGEVHTGDHVDVIGVYNSELGAYNGQLAGSGQATPVARVLLTNVPVLSAPATAGNSASFGTSATRNVVLDVPDNKAAQVAFSSENGKLWLVDRPKVGAEKIRQGVVSLETIIVGSKPISTAPLGHAIDKKAPKAIKKLAAGIR